MKVNKLKILLIAIFCLISASHSETQGMENVILNAQNLPYLNFGEVVATQRSETDRLDILSQEFISYKLQIEQEREASNRILDQVRQENSRQFDNLSQQFINLELQLNQQQIVITNLNEQLKQKVKELEVSQQKNCPKWVVFNGLDGSTFYSSGVSSVDRKGNGWYTVNFLEPFSSKEYCHMLDSGNGDNSIGLNATSAHHPDSQSEHYFTFHTFLTNTTSTTNPLVVSAIFYGGK